VHCCQKQFGSVVNHVDGRIEEAGSFRSSFPFQLIVSERDQSDRRVLHLRNRRPGLPRRGLPCAGTLDLRTVEQVIDEGVAVGIGKNETWGMQVEKRRWQKYHTIQIIEPPCCRD
jgi:hypothetical protein